MKADRGEGQVGSSTQALCRLCPIGHFRPPFAPFQRRGGSFLGSFSELASLSLQSVWVPSRHQPASQRARALHAANSIIILTWCCWRAARPWRIVHPRKAQIDAAKMLGPERCWCSSLRGSPQLCLLPAFGLLARRTRRACPSSMRVRPASCLAYACRGRAGSLVGPCSGIAAVRAAGARCKGI